MIGFEIIKQSGVPRIRCRLVAGVSVCSQGGRAHRVIVDGIVGVSDVFGICGSRAGRCFLLIGLLFSRAVEPFGEFLIRFDWGAIFVELIDYEILVLGKDLWGGMDPDFA